MSFAAFTEVLVDVYSDEQFTKVSKPCYHSKKLKSKHIKSIGTGYILKPTGKTPRIVRDAYGVIKRKVFKKRIELIPLPFCKNGMIRKLSKQLNEIIKQFLWSCALLNRGYFLHVPSISGKFSS